MEDEKVFQFEAKLNSARHFQAFFFVLFLVVCSVFIGAYLSLYKEYEFQKEKLETLEWFVYKDSKSKIDLTETSFQNLSDGFNIAVKTVDTHLTGIKIKGMILNTQSVDYESAHFTITIANANKDFVVTKIPHGCASDFDVYIPDISTEDTKTASVSYHGATIKYLK